MRLSLEEKEQIISFLDTSNSKLLFRLLQEVIEQMEHRVLSVSMDDEDAEQRLIYEKCRVEGAQRLFVGVKQTLNSLSKKAGKTE